MEGGDLTADQLLTRICLLSLLPQASPMASGGQLTRGAPDVISCSPAWWCSGRARGLPPRGCGSLVVLAPGGLAHFLFGDHELQTMEVGSAQMLFAPG